MCVLVFQSILPTWGWHAMVKFFFLNKTCSMQKGDSSLVTWKQFQKWWRRRRSWRCCWCLVRQGMLSPEFPCWNVAGHLTPILGGSASHWYQMKDADRFLIVHLFWYCFFLMFSHVRVCFRYDLIGFLLIFSTKTGQEESHQLNKQKISTSIQPSPFIIQKQTNII